MEAHVVFALSLAIFFHGAQSATVTFINSCSFTVWPATLTGAGSQLSTTGFELAPFNSFTIDVPAPWSGRFWGRTQCADVDGKFQCATADCGTGQITCNGLGAIPPASLVEFTLAGFGLQDFFDISLVDGFNLPVSLSPLNTSQNITGNCIVTSCPTNINNICPQELQVKGTAEDVIACKSACLAFNQPQYCCTGNFGSPTTCPPTSYSNDFKAACPQAYSYAYDDQTSTFACATGVNYNITFCPGN